MGSMLYKKLALSYLSQGLVYFAEFLKPNTLTLTNGLHLCRLFNKPPYGSSQILGGASISPLVLKTSHLYFRLPRRDSEEPTRMCLTSLVRHDLQRRTHLPKCYPESLRQRRGPVLGSLHTSTCCQRSTCCRPRGIPTAITLH